MITISKFENAGTFRMSRLMRNRLRICGRSGRFDWVWLGGRVLDRQDERLVYINAIGSAPPKLSGNTMKDSSFSKGFLI